MALTSFFMAQGEIPRPLPIPSFDEEQHKEPLDDAAPEPRPLAGTVRAFLSHLAQPAGGDHQLAAGTERESQGESLPRTLLAPLPGRSVGPIPTPTERASCRVLPVDKATGEVL